MTHFERKPGEGPVASKGDVPSVHFAVIGDVHAHYGRLRRVLERIGRERVDAVLFVGDLGSHDLAHVLRRSPARDARYLASVARVLDAARELGAPVLYVPGNHDLPTLPFEGNVDGKVVEVAGVRVAGIGGAGPGRFGFAYEWDEDDIRRLPAIECDLLLCHAPPARTELDRVLGRGEHVGSEALRERALAHDGAYVCGHIHEAPGVEQLGRCLCLNVGGLGAPFGSAQVGFLRIARHPGGLIEARHEDLERETARNWCREA